VLCHTYFERWNTLTRLLDTGCRHSAEWPGQEASGNLLGMSRCPLGEEGGEHSHTHRAEHHFGRVDQ